MRLCRFYFSCSLVYISVLNLFSQHSIAFNYRRGSQTKVFSKKSSSRLRLYCSNENINSDIESNNVDIFAAGDRVDPDKTLTTTNPIKTEDRSTPQSLIQLQAEYLRLEAEKEEILISQSRIEKEKKRLQKIDAFILSLLEAEDVEQCVLANRSVVRKELLFRLAELANSSTDAGERRGYFGLYDAVLAVVKSTDPTLYQDLTSDVAKELSLEAERARGRVQSVDNGRLPASPELQDTVRVYDQALQQWMQTVDNTTRGMNNRGNISFPGLDPGFDPGNTRIMRFPSSLPVDMLPAILRGPEVSTADVDLIRDEVFQDLLNNTLTDYSTFLATFRGVPVGGRSVEEVVEEARKRIEGTPGLRERVRLMVLPDYNTQRVEANIEKYSGLKFDPVFTILSSSALPSPDGGIFRFLSLFLSLLGTLVTVFIYSTDIYSLNADFLSRATAGDTSVLDRIIPVVGYILALQIVHDIGHVIAAKIHDVKLGFPVLLPSLQIGIYGSVTRLLSYPKDRKQLFDIAISGPLLGFLASLSVTGIGLSLTQTATASDLASFPAIPQGFFSSSLLLYQLSDVFLHISSVADPTTLVPIHPLVAVGVTGVLANSLNFMPIGRLDGGRVAMAVAGRQAAGSLAFATLILQAVSFIENTNLISLFWVLFVVFFQRTADLPPEDDVTPVATEKDDQKKGLVWFARAAALGFCVLCTAGGLLPQPTVQSAQQVATTQAERVEGLVIPGQQNYRPPTI